MTRFNSTSIRRALKGARHAYASAVERQADAVTDKARDRAARHAKAARRSALENMRAAEVLDLAGDF